MKLTSTQARILGYLISVGGNPQSGSSVKEIREATGLKHNATYYALRQGIPGVAECGAKTKTGAIMYYAQPQALKMNEGPSEPTKVRLVSIWDSSEWAGVPEKVFAGLSETFDAEPASVDRISALIDKLNELPFEGDDVIDRLYVEAIACQVITMHALSLVKELEKSSANTH